MWTDIGVILIIVLVLVEFVFTLFNSNSMGVLLMSSNVVLMLIFGFVGFNKNSPLVLFFIGFLFCLFQINLILEYDVSFVEYLKDKKSNVKGFYELEDKCRDKNLLFVELSTYNN